MTLIPNPTPRKTRPHPALKPRILRRVMPALGAGMALLLLVTLGARAQEPGGGDPMQKPYDQPMYAVHVTGRGQENTATSSAFVQLNASLNSPSATQQGTVDARAYIGIQFYAIINTGTTGARLTVGDLYTDPIGGRCMTNPAPGDKTGCFDHPGAQLTIGTTWMKYQIPFDSLTQLGFGNKSPVGAQFPKDAITLLKWDIGIPSTGPTAAWELWVDDLTFY